MARFNGMMTGLAAAGLALAQPAAAALRAPAAIADSEALTDAPGSGMVVGLLGLVGLVFLIMAISDGSDPTQDLPTSP